LSTPARRSPPASASLPSLFLPSRARGNLDDHDAGLRDALLANPDRRLFSSRRVPVVSLFLLFLQQIINEQQFLSRRNPRFPTAQRTQEQRDNSEKTAASGTFNGVAGETRRRESITGVSPK
jgi:hypothetical protein